MKRVLFVCTQMEAGGVQVLATAMAQALVDDGVESRVAFLYTKRAVFDGPEIISLYPRKPRGWAFVVILFRFLKLIRSYRPTAIVGMAHYSSPLACLGGWLFGVKRRVATQTSPERSVNRVARGLDLLCGMLGAYTANVAASRSIEGDFVRFPRRYRRKLSTIYNGVRVHLCDEPTSKVRREFGLPFDAFVMVTCGRLAPVKNHAMLLDVVSKVPGVHLAIAGDGELRASIEAEIGTRGIEASVTLLGEIDPHSVGRFLSCGDLFLFPSKYEAFGMAAVEAMQAGLPLIASNYPAIAEVVGDAGLLLDPADSEAWVEAVVELRRDDVRRRSLATAARERGSRFSFGVMLDGYKALFL